MAFNKITHLITQWSTGISISDISVALDVSIEEYSLRSLARRPEVNMWSKKKPVSSTIDSMLNELNLLDVKYGLNIPHTTLSFNYVNVGEWKECYRGDWERALITDKNYRLSDWNNYYTEAKPPITIVDMSTFTDASTAWVMMEDGVTENYADISVLVPSANIYQISLSDLEFPLVSGGKDSYLSNCHLVALCLCEDTFTVNPYVNGIGSDRKVSRVFINPKKLTESGGLRMYIPASLSYSQKSTNYQNMTVIPMIGVEPMRLPNSSDNATIFYQTTLSEGSVDYEHVRNVPSQLVPIPKTKGGYMAWHYKAPYGGRPVPKLFSITNDSSVRWSVDSSVWYGDFGASATPKHVHMNPYWYTENYSIRTLDISTNHTFYVSCSVFNPNTTIIGITSSSIKYSVNGAEPQTVAALVDDSFNTVSSISFFNGSSNRMYMELSDVTLQKDTDVPIRFTAYDGEGKYVHIGTLYFRGELDFVAEMGTDKILDVSVFVDEIPAKGGSVSRADIYYTFDTRKPDDDPLIPYEKLPRRHYVFTDFLVEAETLGTTYSPENKLLQLVPFTLRDRGQIYRGSFWVEQKPNKVVKLEFVIDEHSIQQFKGDGESDLTKFDSNLHQKAFYIMVLVNGYNRKTYTSGSIQNMDMLYGVADTSNAGFTFYLYTQNGTALEIQNGGWAKLGEYTDDKQYIYIDENHTFSERKGVLVVTYNSQSVSYNYKQSGSSLPLRINGVNIETNVNSNITVDLYNSALFNNSLGAFLNESTPLYTDKGKYTYNFKLGIRLNGTEFANENGGDGVDLNDYSIWLEIEKSDGLTYRINLILRDTNNHYIPSTVPVDVYFDALIDGSIDASIFYPLFSEYYDTDGNWIGDGEIKVEVSSWKVYLDTAYGVTPNLTPQLIGEGLYLTSNDGSQSYTRG